MRLEACSFCSAPCYPGAGMTFVRNDSRIFKFCRSKCHKNFKMKRNPRKVRWTKAFRKAHGKEMTIDSTFEFEKRRNVPIKYDRELMATTIAAVKRVGEVRRRRERAFHKSRMSAANPESLERDALEVTRSAHLLGAQPSEATQKAIAAAERILAARAERKRARQQRTTTAKPMEGVESAVDRAMAVASAPAAREKIRTSKIKVAKRQSALQPAADGGMSMDLS